jgi:hypothetical protein
MPITPEAPINTPKKMAHASQAGPTPSKRGERTSTVASPAATTTKADRKIISAITE